MMENELFDVLGRKTKRQGGYMTYIPNFKSPFILQTSTEQAEMWTSSPMNVAMHSRDIC